MCGRRSGNFNSRWGVFKELKDTELFKNAHLILGTVSWNDEIDFSPDTLYLDSKKLIPK
ncbi:DUF2442 domain-containing protein [Candidatus Kaistella beijingensis]|nr:DUF2442 domain-containing protein [Candidatus Kaistella beijingensis]